MKLTSRQLLNLFPHLSDNQIIELSSRSQTFVPNSDQLVEIPAPLFSEDEFMQNLLPINPETGHSDSFLTRFLNARTEAERDLISKFVANVPVSASGDYHLSDNELFDLISPASFQTAGEVEQVRHYFEGIIRASQIELPSENNAPVNSVDDHTVSPSDNAS